MQLKKKAFIHVFTAFNNPSLKCFEGVVIFNYLGDTILESRIAVFMKSFKIFQKVPKFC